MNVFQRLFRAFKFLKASKLEVFGRLEGIRYLLRPGLYFVLDNKAFLVREIVSRPHEHSLPQQFRPQGVKDYFKLLFPPAVKVIKNSENHAGSATMVWVSRSNTLKVFDFEQGLIFYDKPTYMTEEWDFAYHVFRKYFRVPPMKSRNGRVEELLVSGQNLVDSSESLGRVYQNLFHHIDVASIKTRRSYSSLYNANIQDSVAHIIKLLPEGKLGQEIDRVGARFARIVSQSVFGISHGDLHSGNILVSTGTPDFFLVDLETVGYRPVWFDLVSPLMLDPVVNLSTKIYKVLQDDHSLCRTFSQLLDQTFPRRNPSWRDITAFWFLSKMIFDNSINLEPATLERLSNMYERVVLHEANMEQILANARM